MDTEKVLKIAQEISFAFEDMFHEKSKKDMFIDIFNKYLIEVDPGINMEPYDATVALGRKDPAAFESMLKELRDNKLISD